MDRVFHALGDPTRMLIVQRLSTGTALLGELAAPLPMSLPAVHQHVAVLEAAGLVSSTKVGRVRTCRLEPETLTAATAWFEALHAEWDHRLDRLDNYLSALPAENPQG